MDGIGTPARANGTIATIQHSSVRMIPPSTAWKLVRDLGPGWTVRRLRIEAELKLGIVERRLPVSDWDFAAGGQSDDPARGDRLKLELLRSKFLFCPQQLPKPVCSAQVCRDADRVLAGEWPYFSHSWFRTGFPPGWHFNVLDGSHADATQHWSRTAGYRGEGTGDRNGSDIKFVWEPSRFAVAYLLVRAYEASADEKYGEAFWTLVEDWAEKNPPNRGVNWASGQEAAFRVMAWCFGLYGFLNASCSTSQRVFHLVRMIEVHGERIAGFIKYALSQRNNHGISEAVGLFTIGVLFPDLLRAAEWTKMGQQLIVTQLREQVYEDGSYIQHSFNYERALIDLLVWALRLGEIHDLRFADECYEVLDRCMKLMVRFCDLRSGWMPNYGANDGTLVLPLTNCDYTDFRPSIDAAHYLLHGKPFVSEGPWSESSAWLLGRPLSDGTVADCSIPVLRYTRASQPTGSFGPEKKLPSSGYLKLIGTESELCCGPLDTKIVPRRLINCILICGGEGKTSSAMPVPICTTGLPHGQTLSPEQPCTTQSPLQAATRWPAPGGFSGSIGPKLSLKRIQWELVRKRLQRFTPAIGVLAQSTDVRYSVSLKRICGSSLMM